MDFLEQLRAAGISDLDIINTFQYKAGGYSQNGKGSYIFGSTDNSDSIWGEIHFNKYGKLYKITPRKLLVSPKSQSEFIENTLNEINGEHGYNISHRILFSQKPLKGQFQWRNNFRIRPCQNFSQV